MGVPSPDDVQRYLLDLQDRICTGLEAEDGKLVFPGNQVLRRTGTLARPRVLESGSVLERAAVNFSRTEGAALPPAASSRRPELAGQPFKAVSVSAIVHPRNPYAPTTHANLRAFFVGSEAEPRTWWFGGGYDLTPYYGFEEDCRHWHATAREALEKHGPDLYERFKLACDEYFYLPHRNEARGVGGVFFDDHTEAGFDGAFAMVRDLGDSFLTAYLPILARRKSTPYGPRERKFQLYRRGRYVEFNLLYDRGTRYGLLSGQSPESVLASLPPHVGWTHAWRPEPGSREAELYDRFLPARDWLSDG